MEREEERRKEAESGVLCSGGWAIGNKREGRVLVGVFRRNITASSVTITVPFSIQSLYCNYTNKITPTPTSTNAFLSIVKRECSWRLTRGKESVHADIRA